MPTGWQPAADWGCPLGPACPWRPGGLPEPVWYHDRRIFKRLRWTFDRAAGSQAANYWGERSLTVAALTGVLLRKDFVP